MNTTNVMDYKIELSKLSDDDGGGYIAYIPQLDCYGDGETIEDAIKDVRQVAEDIIQLANEDGKEIPNPQYYKVTDDYSGKLTLRIPKSLHKQVTERAMKENCSINQLIQNYIAMGIGYDWGKEKIIINYELKPEEKVLKTIQQRTWETVPGKTMGSSIFNLEALVKGREIK